MIKDIIGKRVKKHEQSPVKGNGGGPMPHEGQPQRLEAINWWGNKPRRFRIELKKCATCWSCANYTWWWDTFIESMRRIKTLL